MDLSTLNDRQREALLYNEGPLLILAGAGSGKTKVVTNKIAYLIENGIQSWKILAITFTNKAAKEMKTRVGKLIDNDIDAMWIGTFHSICLRVLRKNIEVLGYKSNYTIYDRQDQSTLVKDALKDLNLSKDIYSKNSIISQISMMKNEEVSPKEAEAEFKDDIYKLNVAKIYAYYEKKLKENNALDFDDLIIKTVEILRDYKEVRDFYQNKFEYVFVDEYQDTNSIQYKLIKYLAGDDPKLTVVGDNDQSIYKWRGADINNILNFQEDFPGAKIIKLEQNYRSSQKILDTANALIKNNPAKFKKNLWTERKGGSEVSYREFNSSDEESYEISNQILKLNYKGKSFDDMAILYRTNAQSRTFEEKLMREGINYKIVGGLRFYDRAEIKDILAYLKVINNPNDEIALKRIINTPKRGIGDTTVEEIEGYAASHNKSIFEVISSLDESDLNLRSEKSIKAFVSSINLFLERKKDLPLYKLLELVLKETEYVHKLEKEGTVEARGRIDNVNELMSNLMSYPDNYSLEEYLGEMSLLTDLDKTSGNKGVSLMTVHAAKGLEFSIVFLVGMEEGLFPIIRDLEVEEDIEEERRLCYVAVTRAKDLLYISSCKTRFLYGKSTPKLRSRFINEMEEAIENFKGGDEKLLRVINYNDDSKTKTYDSPYREKFKGETYKKSENKKEKPKIQTTINVGDKVSHKIFGKGMVVGKKEKDGDFELVVSFDKKGLKKLMQSFAPLKVEN
ncbi:ATP-dependent helicase [Peptoniphilus raoultii]|uniref:ATP-dependent helicase n=1 Tax=Peptoniphilus raoultii TaxID=1776387 RepID=UPI0008D93EE7|nr:UvrD-helicase domain-containing protein [Peptoniphilus raoultii]